MPPGSVAEAKRSPFLPNARSSARYPGSIYDHPMSPPPGLAGARRSITIAGLVVCLLAVLGAVAYSFQETGNNCGSGWAAARKPLPSPLLTEEDKARIQRERLQPYEFGVAKARPIRECRSAGARRLITAGVGASLILLPVGALLAFVNWPRREEQDGYIDLSGDAGPPPGAPPSAPAGPTTPTTPPRRAWGDQPKDD